MTYRTLLLLVCLVAPAAAASAQVRPPDPVRRPDPVRPADVTTRRDPIVTVSPTALQAVVAEAVTAAQAVSNVAVRTIVAEAVTSAQTAIDISLPELSRTVVMSPQRQTWYQEDPADSLFRAAHGLFTRQEYRAGADRFAQVRSRFPTTKYYCDAGYYEAFSRYRLGTLPELRTAHTVLDGLASRCTTTQRRADLPELQTRVDGALARLGDGAAADRVRRAASQGTNVCDREERTIKTEALSALAQMDAQAADPVLRTVLNTKDDCSAPVRRQALSLVARRNDAAAAALLAQSARNDPNDETRIEAVRALGRMTGDAGFSALEDLLRTSPDPRVQMTIADAMARSEQPRAQAAIRALIERQDVSERIRLSAVNALAARPNITTDYWRSLYPRMESEELRKAVVNAVGRSTSSDAQQFLLTLARNQSEPHAVRIVAVSRIRASAPISDLYQLYQNADSRTLRISVVNGLIARKEPEATERLIDIAKTSTDVEVRRTAIQALGKSPRKDEPRVARALAEILSGTTP